MPAPAREQDSLGSRGFKTDGVAVSPPEACRRTTFEPAGHVVDVVSIHHLGDATDEGDRSAYLDLVLHRPVDLSDVDSEQNRRDRGA